MIDSKVVWGGGPLAELRKPKSIPTPLRAHVVFFHGLNGSNEKSWLSAGEPKQFWPEWLQEDLTDVAVWSVGYPATSTWWKRGGAMALTDRAANVLSLLLDETDLTHGSLILVGYSLGGLVIEQILRDAQSKSAHDTRAEGFLTRVRRVAFLSTPHFGSDTAALANAISWLTRPRETLTGLSRNDPNLRGLNTWFRRYAEEAKLEACILRETKPMKNGFFIVKPDSADPGLSPATDVIPVDEDHDSIRSPKDRQAEVYRHVLAFVRKPFVRAHPAASRDECLASIATGVSDLQTQQKELVQALALHSSGNGVVTQEAERRLWQIRRSRYINGYDAKAEATRLLNDIQNGELSTAARDTRRKIFAWCARLLAGLDHSVAEGAYKEAQALGAGEENILAEAFLLVFGKADKASALAKVSSIDTKSARTAAFLIAANGVTPEEAVQWLNNANLQSSDLDPDGKLQLLQRRLQMKDWGTALADVLTFGLDDYDAAPGLLTLAGMTHLVQAVPSDFREAITFHLPTDLSDFPLSTDGSSRAYLETAQPLFKNAATSLGQLGLDQASGVAADYALWLDLRNPGSTAQARKELESSLSDPKLRLRRVPMALDFRLKLDRAAVEREIDAETARTGGKSRDAAAARLAMAMSRKDAMETARDIALHRKQLVEYYSPQYIEAVEVEVLARSGQVNEARSKLAAIDVSVMPPETLKTLARVIEEVSGADPTIVREAEYLASKKLIDLIHLVDALKGRNAHAKLAEYGKLLFDETHSLAHAVLYANALYEEGRDRDVIELVEAYPDLLATSSELETIAAWSYYRLGNLAQAKTLLSKLQLSHDLTGDRHLQINIAIASGDWSSLGTIVETEWTRRDTRSAKELLRAGQIAQHIGASGRSQELVRAAAAKANGDPAVLVGCYSMAASGGWEDDAAIHEWLNVAAEASGENGPIQKLNLGQLVKMQPKHRERQEEIWQSLITASLPLFVAAKGLNRTLVDLIVVPALVNQRSEDPRQRGLIFTYSGARPIVPLPGKRLAFDVTSILTLAILGLLRKTIAAQDTVFISHTTLGWLFEERQKLEFHQPSQVREAAETKRLIDSGHLHRFDGTSGSQELEQQFGDDIARYLVAAQAADPSNPNQKLIVRPYPLPKPESLLEEIADTTQHENFFVGCLDVVTALRKLGRITAAEEEQATAYLALHEKPWPHTPIVNSGATLFLDDLAAAYFQHVKLLDRLKSAGFNVFISDSFAKHGDALIRHDVTSAEAKRLVEEIRSALEEGLSSGKVQLIPLGRETDDADEKQLAHHPTMGIFRADVDAIVIDDRSLNQNSHLPSEAGTKATATTVDILVSMRSSGVLSASELAQALTVLRDSGFVFVPTLPGQLLELVSTTTVDGGMLQEPAELRAIRESILRIRMTDALQHPSESNWIDSMLREFVDVIRAQWTDEVPDDVARARSNWMLRQFDLRGWAHRNGQDKRSPLDRYRAQVGMLLMLPKSSAAAKKRYWEWLDDAVLVRLEEEQPDEYQKLIDMLEEVITRGTDEMPKFED
ncbi:MAG: hypothetical protein R3C52_10435 [Hyphomonadaceae bacterium]